jgi:hypothetical protein
MTRRTPLSIAAIFGAMLLFLQLVPTVSAEDEDRDPPARAGRIGYLRGSVSFQPGGQGDWLDAVANRPLTTGDNLWADKDALAEVQIGSTSIRLGSETSVTFLDLDNHVTQLRLSMGSLFFRVRHASSDDTLEISTPNLAFTVNQPGEYRVDVNENGDDTTARVFHGEAEITGAGSSYRLLAGQRGTFSGVDQLRYDVDEVGAYDEFDRWCLDRDQHEDHIQSLRYVSPEITGYEDLDEYGRWRYVPTYGYVWTPVGVPYGWAPYRYGHWVFVAPWGWTWVEQEPWGFAPFHYGRWAFVAGGWCWVPGPVALAPVYSPALVAFVGGGGFHTGVGVGVGWFPLAPGEVYVPWYRTSPRYVQTVNITNTRVTMVEVTNVYHSVTVNRVTNVTYINQRVTNGVTVVNRETFVNARPVAANVVRVDQRQIVSAPINHEVVTTIQPSRQSVIGVGHPVRVAPPPQIMSREVVSTRQPVSFNRPAVVPGETRTFTPAPVRTVRAAPSSEAPVLTRGAHGAVAATSNTGRAVSVENGRGPANYGSSPHPGGEQNPAVVRPGMGGPRPGGQQSFPMTPERGAASPRPGVDQPTTEVRPATPESNRPARELPRPPSSRPEPPQFEGQQQRTVPTYSRPETPRNTSKQPGRAESFPNDNRHQSPVQSEPAPLRPSRPEQPTYSRPETPRNVLQPPAQPQAFPNENRHESVPVERQAVPVAPSRPPERVESAAPRNEAHPAAAPQHPSRQEEHHGSDNQKGKEPEKFR